MMWVAVAVAGGLGAVVRYLVDLAVSRLAGGRFPWGTVAVNVSGSLVAGLVAGLAISGHLGVEVEVVVAGGFLGAYTTFSTAMVQAAVELRARLRTAAALQLIGTLALAVAAAWLGVTVTS